jgi:hypothetical protein
MGQDLCDGLGLGEEGDERERFLAGGADQGEDFIDPSQKSRPPGGTGGGGIRCVRLSPLWLDSRSRRGCRERKRGLGSLSGQDIVLPGLLGDQRPQGRIGGKNPVVSVAVDAGWGEDLGQAVEELEG